MTRTFSYEAQTLSRAHFRVQHKLDALLTSPTYGRGQCNFLVSINLLIYFISFRNWNSSNSLSLSFIIIY